MIYVDNVSVCFKMPRRKINGLKEYVISFFKRELLYDEFCALNNISFNIKKGEVVGIIGRNGAGKSTLLKVISGILKPNLGKVSVKGNIVPMLELGSGFDYNLTGRENIFLNGAILGYNKEYLIKKYDDILEFSQLYDFIDIPIKNYSSGMFMRLAFSIATVVKPEILIVDEILAVGDEEFQKKSKDRMISMMKDGTTVLFVSHNFEQIKQLCNRVIVMDKGNLVYDGSVDEAYEIYTNINVK